MFEEIGGEKKYYKYSECEKGQVLCEGIYKRQGIDKTYGKPFWEVMCKENGLVHLNYAGGLALKFEEIEVGDAVKVVFEGKITLEKGPYAGKEANTFKVFKATAEKPASEDTIPGNIEDDFDVFGI